MTRTSLKRLKVLAGLVIAIGVAGAAAAQPPQPQPPHAVTPVVERLAGSDRFATALAISRGAFDAAADVVIATGVVSPDALAAAPLARALDAPLLLSHPEALPVGLLAELDRLGTSRVWLIGGDAALSAGVEAALVDTGRTVERVAGPERIATAAAVAALVAPTAADALLASGEDAAFADALSAGSFGVLPQPFPVLLTHRDQVPEMTLTALEALGVATVHLIGGEAAVAEPVMTQLAGRGLQVVRHGGGDRYATSRAVNDHVLARSGATDRAPNSELVVATGATFPDALAGGALVGQRPGLLVLTPPDDLDRHEAVVSLLASLAGTVDRVSVLGGEAAMAPVTVDRIVALLTGPPRHEPTGPGPDPAPAEEDPPPDSLPDDAPDDGPVSSPPPAAGPPAPTAVDLLPDTYAGPAPAEHIDESGMLLSRVGVLIAPTATPAQFDALLADIDATIAWSRPGLPVAHLDIPVQPDPSTLLQLLDVVRADPAVLAAFPDRIAEPQVLPTGDGAAPVDPGDLPHLLPTRFPAAWNAASLLQGCQARPVRVLVADYFAPFDPEWFIDQFPVASITDRSGFLPTPQLGADHGYNVLLAMAGRHDAEVPTGAHPMAECLEVQLIEAATLGGTDLIEVLADRVTALDANVITNLSIGWGNNLCGAGADEPCDDQLTGLTSQALQDDVARRIAATLMWASTSLTPESLRHALWTFAAGNDANKPVGITYRGFSDGPMSYHLSNLLSLLDIPGTYSGPVWTPADRPSAQLPADVLEGFQDSAAELRTVDRFATRNVAVVGATGPYVAAPGPVSPTQLSRAPFSNRGADLLAVGTDVLIGEVDGVPVQIDGTSFAAPQVAGLAAYLWLLSDDLRGQPAEATLDHLSGTAAVGPASVRRDIVDAYAAVLALDRPGQDKRIRRAILDVDGNGRFDQDDIADYLAAFDAADPADGPGFSRYDLNGDGHTGGDLAVPMDLDAERYLGTIPELELLAVNIGDRPVTFDERAVTDLDALCVFAYDPFLGLFDGDDEKRDDLLADRCAGAPRMVLTYNTSLISGITITLGVTGPDGVTIDWGDGHVDRDVTTDHPSHTYDSDRTYTVTVTGTFDGFTGPTESRLALLSVDEWGETNTTTLRGAFQDADNLTSVARPPATVTDMFRTFFASPFNAPIGDWDTSNVTTMGGMFLGATNFDQPIGGWDTGKLTDMGDMFAGARAFNQPIGDWDTSKVTNMDSVFFRASAFNQRIGGWDTGAVFRMNAMFFDAVAFNQDLSGWAVSNVFSCNGFAENTPAWTAAKPSFTNC